MVTATGAFNTAPVASPGVDLLFITPSDTVDVPQEVTRGLLCNQDCSARLILASGKDTGATNLVPLQKGWNPVGVRRVYATGLTASTAVWGVY